MALASISAGQTKIRPKVLLRYGRINQPIRVPIYDLLVDSQTTFLVTDSLVGATSLSVKNTTSFAVNQILLIGAPGQQGSEIVKVSSTVAPTTGTITLAGPLMQPHGANTTIYIINYDMVEYSTAVNLQDPKVVLGTLAIVADNLETDWNDNFTNGGYYFARWFNSNTNLFSPYSDGVPLVSYTKYMARSIIQRTLGEINKDTSNLLTDEFMFQQINSCQEEVLSEQKRWSFMQKFDQKVWQSLPGEWKFPCPPDLPEDQTNKFVYQLRLGNNFSYNWGMLTWIDKEQMNKFLVSVAYSNLALPVYEGDVTITLEDSGDFQLTQGESAGTVWIGNQGYEYVANDTSTGVLTLKNPAPVGYAWPAGYSVFQGAQVGYPQYWTSYGGMIYIYPIINQDQVGLPMLMDYYAEAVEITTDTDEIPFPDAVLAQYYLEWKCLLRLNKGQETEDSQEKRSQFQARLTKLVQKNSLGRTFRLVPRMNNWAQQESLQTGDPQRIRDGAFPNI